LGIQIADLREDALLIIKKVQFLKIGSSVFVAGIFLVFLRENLNLKLFPMLILSFGGFFGIYGGMLLLFRELIVMEIVKSLWNKRRRHI